MPFQKASLRALRAFLFVLLCASAVAAQDEESAATAEGPISWSALSLRRTDAGVQATQFWSKGPMLRSETVLGGHKVVTLVRGEDYVAYDAFSRRGISIKRHPDAVALDTPDRRPFGNEYELLLARGAEPVGDQDGRIGSFRLTDDFGRRELQVTLDADHVPLRLEVWHRQSNQRSIIDYANWQNSLAIPDTFFEPEADVELESLSLEEYLALSASPEPVKSIPVLHGDLLAPQP